MLAGVAADETIEDTRPDEDETLEAHDDETHRNFDTWVQHVTPGTKFPSAKNVPSARRRQHHRLAVSRTPLIAPVGASRESHYESRLILAFPWFCSESPAVTLSESGQNVIEWTLWAQMPPPEDLGGVKLDPVKLVLSDKSGVSFEERCSALECMMCSPELDIICQCCQGDIGGHCPSCRHAVGLHRCYNRERAWGDLLKWKKGTLFLGPTLDPQRNIFNLHRKGVPTDALQNTCQNYVENGYMTSEVARRILQVIEQERGTLRLTGEACSSADTPAGLDAPAISPKMSVREMEAELSKREALMRAGDGPGETDQWRSERKMECSQSPNTSWGGRPTDLDPTNGRFPSVECAPRERGESTNTSLVSCKLGSGLCASWFKPVLGRANLSCSRLSISGAS